MSGSDEIPALVRRLHAVAGWLRDDVRRWEAARDRRAVFGYAYATITERIAEVLPTMGFDDPAWVVALDEAFAAEFRRAADAVRPESAPPGWRPVLGALMRRRTSVFEDLVLGMVAHIVYDLPHALLAVEQGAPHARHIRDFHRMNDLLARGTGAIQDAVARRYNPWLHWLDRLGGRLDEVLTDYGMRLARGMAWYNAERLAAAAAAGDAGATEESLARSVTKVVALALDPPAGVIGLGLRLLRLVASFGKRWPSS